ncbi:MAG: hypothetical protein DRO88_03600 [Promethearchaeia archaeon]|nr:MAG: hypothetical protein DRO88_03600 [Candidatus Lokiarchaeia archaeon]
MNEIPDLRLIQESSENSLDKNPSAPKAIVLLSGGLDSAIAAKLVIDQGINVVALNFHSPFCTCSSNSKYNQCGAVYFASRLRIPIKTISKGDDYLEIVKNPKFGYGKNMNPCIDCRIHILEKTKAYMKEIGAKFVVTGEVLGQRPKSQMLHALQTIERAANMEGKILRPLSAKLLPPTDIEKEGIVDREKLLAIHGRRRNIQVELGKNYELIQQYCAGGGCRLTDKNFARKLRDYFDNNPVPQMKHMKYLKIGRHFRYEGAKIIVGKDEQENKMLETWAQKSDVILSVKNIKGPSTLVQAPKTDAQIKFAAQLTLRYSDAISGDYIVEVRNSRINNQWTDITIQQDPEIMQKIEEYRV